MYSYLHYSNFYHFNKCLRRLVKYKEHLMIDHLLAKKKMYNNTCLAKYCWSKFGKEKSMMSYIFKNGGSINVVWLSSTGCRTEPPNSVSIASFPQRSHSCFQTKDRIVFVHRTELPQVGLLHHRRVAACVTMSWLRLLLLLGQF